MSLNGSLVMKLLPYPLSSITLGSILFARPSRRGDSEFALIKNVREESKTEENSSISDSKKDRYFRKMILPERGGLLEKCTLTIQNFVEHKYYENHQKLN